jgi:cytochrome c oxidase accessory protein FixG
VARRLVSALLIAIYVLLPWLQVGGYPAVFLDIAERRFHLFGWTVASQEMWLLFFLLTGMGFSLFFVTALLGRVWCGWACPQTVFLEHVFRWIERRIEGDAQARKSLDAAPWDSSKVTKRVLKHVLFALCSALVAHIFLAYFVSIPRLYAMMTSAPTDHWEAFLFVFAASGTLYANFAWFREQLCIVICPYGRLQSALVDDHSLVVGYDIRRGEPRRQRAASAATPQAASTTAGDCIDCVRCVQVCPTGIDIRQGLQMECLACTACIDSCDEVMTKVGKPRGLVRYDSLASFGGGRTRWLRPRTILYSVLLLVGAGITLKVISGIRPIAFEAMRMPGGSYFVDPDAVRNQMLVRLTNKTNAPRRVTLLVDGAPSGLVTSGTDEPVVVAPMAEDLHTVIVRMPLQAYKGSFRWRIAARDEDGGYILDREVEFLGPDPQLLNEDYWREKTAR